MSKQTHAATQGKRPPKRRARKNLGIGCGIVAATIALGFGYLIFAFSKIAPIFAIPFETPDQKIVLQRLSDSHRDVDYVLTTNGSSEQVKKWKQANVDAKIRAIVSRTEHPEKPGPEPAGE